VDRNDCGSSSCQNLTIFRRRGPEPTHFEANETIGRMLTTLFMTLKGLPAFSTHSFVLAGTKQHQQQGQIWAGRARCDTGCMRSSLPELMASPPAEVLIVTDYDGTIAPIVADPAVARPAPDAVEVLSALVPLVRGVAVLSGRTERSLRSFLPVPGAVLIGENGIESLTPGERSRLAGFEDRARRAVAPWPGVVIETKPASLSVHFRAQPEIAGELENILRDLIAGSGLMMIGNRMVFDIQSPRGSKVRTMCRLMREMDPAAVVYAGDSRDDARVHRFLSGASMATLCIGMASIEMPAGLFKKADLVLDGPPEMVTLLGRLVHHWSGPPSGLQHVPDALAG
jgi:trehalose 6-phosphate phosphatase